MPGVSKGRRARLENLKRAHAKAQRQKMLQKLLKVKLERELEEGEAPPPHAPGDMEVGEPTLCLLCCYSFAASPRNYLAGEPVLKQFLKESDFFPDATITAEELLLGDTKQVSLCPECTAQLTLAVRRREKMAEVEGDVRQVQLELLRLMTRLSVVTTTYLQSVERLTEKITLSDEKCLRQCLKKEGARTRRQRNVFKFRAELVTGVTKLKRFQEKMNNKFSVPDPVPPPDDTNDLEEEETSVSPETEVKSEQLLDAEEEEVASFSLPSQFILTPAAETETKHETLWGEMNENETAGVDPLAETPPRPPPPVQLSTVAKRKRVHKPLLPCPHCHNPVSNLPRHVLSQCPRAPHWTAEHPWPHTCAECGARCRGPQDLDLHQRVKHRTTISPNANSPRQVKCESCGKLISRDFRARHLRHFCAGRPAEMRQQFVCDLCGAVLSSKNSLDKHQKDLHGTETFTCDLCGKAGFKSQNKLRLHKKRHWESASRRWICERCGGTFSCATHLRSHRKFCDGTKKPRAPRWTNIVQPISSPQTTGNATGEKEGQDAFLTGQGRLTERLTQV